MLVTAIYESDEQYDIFKEIEKDHPDYEWKFLYAPTKDAFRVKRRWAAKKSPFAMIEDGDKLVKIFYSEAINVIDELKKYLNENNCVSSPRPSEDGHD